MAEFKSAAAGETEAQWRQFLSYLFAQDSTGLSTDGVLAGLAVTQTTTASVSVLVAVGGAVVQDTLINGASPLVSNAPKTLDVLTANPVGSLPRNDIVVFDAATATIRNLVGTPNSVPTDPTIPATAAKLARLRHAANATTVPGAKIDDIRVMTSLKGDSGRILGVYSGLFYTNLPASGTIPANSVWGATPQNVAQADLPDQGRPYRLMVNAYAEWGTEGTGTRWDFAATVAGVDFGVNVAIAEAAMWRPIVSKPSPVLTGAQTVYLRAGRVYGTGLGTLTPYNRDFTVTVYAA